MASVAAAIAAALLFVLQPLLLLYFEARYAGDEIIQFFQWIYLGGMVLVVFTAHLEIRRDVSFALLVLAVSSTLLLLELRSDGLESLWSVAPFGVWLASCSTVLVRCVGRAFAEDQSRPYVILSAASVGSTMGVLLGLVISAELLPVSLSWLTVCIGALVCAFAVMTLIMFRLPAVEGAATAESVQPAKVHGPGRTLLWVLLAAIPSSGVVVVARISSDLMPEHTAAALAAPLGLMLMAYTVGWSSGAALGNSITLRRRGLLHASISLTGVLLLLQTFSGWQAGLLMLIWYAVCAATVECLRRVAPPARESSAFQFWQALGGAVGGWLTVSLATGAS